VAFIFFSGAASGLVFACIGIILTLAITWLWSKLFPASINHDDLVDSVKWMGGMCLYFYCYALSAALLRRHLLNRVGTELTWLMGVILMMLGIVIPFLVGYMIYFKDAWWTEDYGKWLIGNPFAWSNKSHRVFYFEVAAVWAVVVTACNIYWFLGRAKNFRPPNARDAIDHERSS
jgi:hypothetical protein